MNELQPVNAEGNVIDKTVLGNVVTSLFNTIGEPALLNTDVVTEVTRTVLGEAFMTGILAVPPTVIFVPALIERTPLFVTVIAVVPLTLIPEPATIEVIAEEAPVVAQYVGLLLGVRFTLAPKREI